MSRTFMNNKDGPENYPQNAELDLWLTFRLSLQLASLLVNYEDGCDGAENEFDSDWDWVSDEEIDAYPYLPSLSTEDRL